MKHLEYKNFLGSIEFSVEDNVFHGKLLKIKDLVTYEAAKETGLEKEFRLAVDDYLKTCEEIGKAPQKAL